MEVLKAKEVAALLNIHIKTVYILAKSGEIPAMRVGRSWRFLHDEIIAKMRFDSVIKEKEKQNG